MNKKIIISLLIMFFSAFTFNLSASDAHESTKVQTEKKEYQSKTLGELAVSFYATTGIKALFSPSDDVMTSEAHSEDARLMTTFEQTWGRLIMFILVFIYGVPLVYFFIILNTSTFNLYDQYSIFW